MRKRFETSIDPRRIWTRAIKYCNSASWGSTMAWGFGRVATKYTLTPRASRLAASAPATIRVVQDPTVRGTFFRLVGGFHSRDRFFTPDPRSKERLLDTKTSLTEGACREVLDRRATGGPHGEKEFRPLLSGPGFRPCFPSNHARGNQWNHRSRQFGCESNRDSQQQSAKCQEDARPLGQPPHAARWQSRTRPRRRGRRLRRRPIRRGRGRW